MQTERIPIETGIPVEHGAIERHFRVDGGSMAAEADAYVRIATAEIETYCDIAVLNTEIVATTDGIPDQIVTLPIGPARHTPATVETIADDGTTAELSDGWRLEAGRRGRILFDSPPTTRVRITYQAGFGTDAESVPRDLQHAILDQAVKSYDMRGQFRDARSSAGARFDASLSPAAARIAARYRRVAL